MKPHFQPIMHDPTAPLDRAREQSANLRQRRRACRSARRNGLWQHHGWFALLVCLACLLGGLPAAAQTTRTWTGPSGGQWSTPSNWTPVGVPENDDIIVVTNGFIVLTNQVNIRGTFNWSGGGLAGSPLRIEPAGVMNIQSPSLVTLQTSLINEGRVNWLSGLISPVCAGFGPIVNRPGAVWDIQCDVNQQGCVGSTNNFFLNQGTLRKSAGSGITAWNIPVRNAGVVSVQQGTLWLQGGGEMDGVYEAAAGATLQFGTGSFTYNNVPVLTGPGRFQFVSGALRLLENLIPRLEIAGGTVELGPEFQGGSITNLSLRGGTIFGTTRVTGFFDWAGAAVASPLTVESGATVNWSAGTALAPITIASNAVLNIASPTSVSLQSSVTNAGTVNWWSGAIGFNCAAFGPIVNLPGAVWDIHGDSSLGSCAGANAFFQNRGMFRKSGSLGTTIWGLPLRNSGVVSILQGTFRHEGGGPLDGNYSVAGGAMLQLAVRAFSYSTPPKSTGPGTVQLISGSLALADDLIPNLSLIGGDVTLGPGFQGGTITNLTLGAGMTLGGANSVSGVFNWAGANVTGPLQVHPGGTVTWSAGTAFAPITIASNAILNIDSPTLVTLQSSLTNAGTVRWLTGALTPSCSGFGPIVNLPGALWDIQCDAPLGSCGANPNGYFLNEGWLRKSAGTGVTEWNHPLRNAGLVSILQGTFKHQGGGPMEGLHELAAGAVMQFGVRSFSAGPNAVLGGPGSAQFISGSLALADDVIPNLSLLGGTVSLSTNFQGGTITNLALGSGVTLAASNTVSGVFNVNGATLAGRLFIWDGATVNWTAGSAAGGITVLSNGLLNVSASGTVTAQGSLTNRGTIAVQQGTLALNGGFVPLGGTLRFGLSGLNSFGRIAIAGATTLDGRLGVEWLNGYVPVLGNSFAVVSYGSRTGGFTDLDLPPAAVWQTNYGATAFTLTVAAINKLVLAPGPVSTNAGAVLAPVIVQVQNSSGVPVAASGVPVTLALASGTGPLNGTLTQVTDANGQATFTNLSLTTAGTKTITATASPAGLTPVTSGTFSISAAAPAQLVLVTAIASPQVAGPFFVPPPLVRVLDAFGNAANSPVQVHVQLSSSGGGRLVGMTNATITGQASLNLAYALADPNVAETFVAYFESPGLPPVTNRPVLASFVVTNIVLQDANSVVRIDPVTQRGLHSWTVDGVEQAHQHWFWLRAGTNHSQASFDKFGTPYGLVANSSNFAINYFSQGLSVQATYDLEGGAANSRSSELSETISIQNTTEALMDLHLFAYSDFDLSNSPYADTVSLPSSNVLQQRGKETQVKQTVLSPVPDAWEAGYYGLTLARLLDASPLTLADTIIPAFPGDQTFAWQWDSNLGPGETMVVRLVNHISPVTGDLRSQTVVPVRLEIALSDAGIILTWPAKAAGDFELQAARFLSPDGNWITLTNTPVLTEGRCRVVLPLSPEPQFYRLK